MRYEGHGLKPGMLQEQTGDIGTGLRQLQCIVGPPGLAIHRLDSDALAERVRLVHDTLGRSDGRMPLRPHGF